MKKLLLAVLAFATLAVAQAQAPDLAGNWQGTLTLPNGKALRTIIAIAKDDNIYKSTFYSIDQGAQGFKADSTKLNGPALTISIPVLGLTYEGKLSPDGNSIAGTFTQGANPLPLLLVRATKETAWEIPAPPPPRKLMAADANPSFDVATIKPNNGNFNQMQQLTIRGRDFATKASSLEDLITFAYNIQKNQIVALPDWAKNDRYDIAGVPDTEGDPNVEQLRIMMRKLIADRFKLTFHHDKRELSAFVLTVGKSGSRLTPTQLSGSLPGIGVGPGKGGVTFQIVNGAMSDFTSGLQSIILDRPVVDQTGLTGKYDLQVLFLPDDSQFNGHPPKVNLEGAEPAPGLFEAIQQTLGLKLEAKKTPVDVLVIDHAEKPTAN